jgi:hypothetical protein
MFVNSVLDCRVGVHNVVVWVNDIIEARRRGFFGQETTLCFNKPVVRFWVVVCGFSALFEFAEFIGGGVV